MTNGSNHLLSFVTNEEGSHLSIHLDLAGVTALIDELSNIKQQLESNDCPHTHLFADPDLSTPNLTETSLATQKIEVNTVGTIKIYGWNEEWAVKHGLKPGKDS